MGKLQLWRCLVISDEYTWRCFHSLHIRVIAWSTRHQRGMKINAVFPNVMKIYKTWWKTGVIRLGTEVQEATSYLKSLRKETSYRKKLFAPFFGDNRDVKDLLSKFLLQFKGIVAKKFSPASLIRQSGKDDKKSNSKKLDKNWPLTKI